MNVRIFNLMMLQETINHSIAAFPPIINNLPLLVVSPIANRSYNFEAKSRRVRILGLLPVHVAASFPRPVCPRIPCLSADITL